MKKIKQVLALIGCILLVGLYISTLVFALMDNSYAMNLLRASIYATVVVPVLIWAYTFIYRLLKNHYAPKDNLDSSADASADSTNLHATSEKDELPKEN